MLWEADFTFLKYRYIDLLQEGIGGGEPADGSDVDAGEPRTEMPARHTRAAVEESKRAGIVNMADFDSTLYFLDERGDRVPARRDRARVPAGSARERRSRALLDIFEAQADSAVRVAR